MKTRAERRRINESKWTSKLKKIFNSKYRNFVQPIKTSDWGNYYKAETYDDLKKDRWSVLLKYVSNTFSDKRYGIKEAHKRKQMNKKLSKENLEDIDIYMEDINNPYAFEKYCGACDNFGTEDCPYKDKVIDLSEWKYIECKKFFD